MGSDMYMENRARYGSEGVPRSEGGSPAYTPLGEQGGASKLTDEEVAHKVAQEIINGPTEKPTIELADEPKAIKCRKVTDSIMGQRLYDKLRPQFIEFMPEMVAGAIFGISAASCAAAEMEQEPSTAVSCEMAWLGIQECAKGNFELVQEKMGEEVCQAIYAVMNFYGPDACDEILRKTDVLINTDSPMPAHTVLGAPQND